MIELEVAKKLITGIFEKNHQLIAIDDYVFIPMIRSGIETAAAGDDRIYEELLNHAIELYQKIWLEQAEESEEVFDAEHEKITAKEEFLGYMDD